MFVAYLVNCLLYVNINVPRHKPTKESFLFDKLPHFCFVSYEIRVSNDSQSKISKVHHSPFLFNATVEADLLDLHTDTEEGKGGRIIC